MAVRSLILSVFVLGSNSLFAQSDKFQDEISYSGDIAPIVKNFCTTCHAGDDPEGDLVLTSYALVREEVENGELLARINDHDDPMPEDGLMPKHLRRAFQQWADSGYLENGTKPKPTSKASDYGEFTPPTIVPVDITKEGGFEMLESMQGHWVGTMTLMGTKFDWMAFDYRPISPSHVHGIFEGGTMGNLFTSFFMADFKGTKTLVARNGGVLNGIYRTSYFVLSEIKKGFGGKKTYRFIDAYGGEQIMSMELTFAGDSLQFKAYTSRLGLKPPQLHMDFRGKRKRPELAAAAATAVGFPEQVVDFVFPNPMPIPTWAEEYPLTSATYLTDTPGKDLLELAQESRDPRRIDQMPYLSKLTVQIDRSKATEGKNLHLYLSQKALTNAEGKFLTQGGYVRMDLLDTLLSFPELSGKANEFTFTYLHPGDYFLTVVADMDGDGFPTPGDITQPLTQVSIAPNSHETVRVSQLDVKN